MHMFLHNGHFRSAGRASGWLGALLLCAAAGRLATADSPYLYGVHWYGDVGTSQVDAMTAGRGIWSLEVVQTNSDIWWGAQWQRDNRFNHMVAQGHTLIVRIERNWGETVPFAGNLPQYLVDVQAAAQTLANVCHIWQIGNEMNINGEWGGNELSAAAYIDAFKQIRAAIRAVPSPLGEQIVILGPVSPGGVIPGVRHTDGLVYLGQMCDLLTADDLDGFGLHAYAAPWLNAADARVEFKSGYVSQLAVIDDKGFAQKPVYITEWNRRADPLTDSNQAQSAQFLYGAFADLNAWNQTPGAHPIVCACWFINQYDSGTWSQYSLEYLKTIGPTGFNNDPWDAFQHACTFEYPAGYPTGGNEAPMFDGTPPGTNVAPLSVSVTTSSNYDANATGWDAIDGIVDADHKWTSSGAAPPHWLMLDLGQVRRLSGMIVRHAGAGGEATYFNTQALQLETATSPGGPWSIDALVANPAQANTTVRTYHRTRPRRYVRLYITDAGIDNYARIHEFEVYETAYGDLDADGDVDAADHQHFAACLAGPAEPAPPGDCAADAFDLLDADADGDLDLRDFAAFAAAFTG